MENYTTEGIIIGLIGVGVIILGRKIAKKGGKMYEECNKYEFENTTSGGVVQFKDYDASVKHGNKKVKAQILMNIFNITLVIGILFIIASIITIWG